MCQVLAVSISGYRAWRGGGTPDSRRLNDAQAVALMKAIHAEVKGAYGSRRMHRELKGRGYCIGLTRVERLMRDNGIRARHKRRYKARTDSRHSMPVADTCWRAASGLKRPIRPGAATSPTSPPMAVSSQRRHESEALISFQV